LSFGRGVQTTRVRPGRGHSSTQRKRGYDRGGHRNVWNKEGKGRESGYGKGVKGPMDSLERQHRATEGKLNT